MTFMKLLLLFALLLRLTVAGELVNMSEVVGKDASGSGETLRQEGSGEEFENSSGMEGSGEEFENSSGMEGSGEDSPSNKKTQLFDPSVTAHFFPMNTPLEELFEIDLNQTEVQENLTELMIEFQLFKHENVQGLDDFYGQALENLLEVTPKLRILHPIGGHFYFPAENGTLDTITQELEFTRDGIQALTSQMHSKNLTLADERFDYIKYDLYLVIDEEALNDTAYFEELERLFGEQPMTLVNKELGTHTVSLLYDVNDFNIKLDINLYTDPASVLSLERNKRIDYKQAVVPLMKLDHKTAMSKLKEQSVELST